MAAGARRAVAGLGATATFGLVAAMGFAAHADAQAPATVVSTVDGSGGTIVPGDTADDGVVHDRIVTSDDGVVLHDGVDGAGARLPPAAVHHRDQPPPTRPASTTQSTTTQGRTHGSR